MTEAKHKVLITRDVGEEAMAIIRNHKELDIIVWPEDRAAPREWVLQNLKGVSGVLLMLSDRVDEEFVEAAGSSLKVVSTMSVGYEHVSVDQLASRKIRLGFTPDVLTEAVADISVMLAFMASRNVGETLEVVNSGKWPTMPWSPFLFTGPQLSHVNPSDQRKIFAGFLGFGRIAQATLHRMVAFGVTDVVFTSASDPGPDYSHLLKRYSPQLRSIRRVSVAEVAQMSDVVFVLTPGGAKTHHLVDEAFLRGMKPEAVLVNTSRGTVVDSDALAKALQEKWIWGAGLDVVEGEPKVGLDHPLVKEPRCVVLPHIGSATLHTRTAMATRAAKNLVAGVLGREMDAEVQQARL